MLKKTITYTDFNDQKVTEDFYFNISKTELLEIELREKIQNTVVELTAVKDASRVYDLFKTLMHMCVGRKSDDGRLFIKDQKAKDDFFYSGAYDEFVMDLISDSKAAAEFVRNVIPSDLQEEIAKQEAKK